MEETKHHIKVGRENKFPHELEREQCRCLGSHCRVKDGGRYVEVPGEGGELAPFSQSLAGGGL